MRLPTRPGTLLALLAGIGLVLGACSSSSTEPTAVSLDEYFRSVQALRDAQERQSEALVQRFGDQLSGDQTDLEEVLAAFEGILPEFLPEFRAVLSETRDGLDEIAPPAAAQDPHADLIEAYDDFVALIDRGVEQLEDGQPPSEVLTALFLDRSGTELGQRFSAIADELSAIADAAGIEGFVGGGPLGVGSTAPDPTTNGGNRVDGTPRPTRVREVGTSSPIGPGISVGEAVSSRLVGPLLVNGYVVIADGEMRLCQTLDQSQPPACGDPSPAAGRIRARSWHPDRGLRCGLDQQ